MEYWAKAPLQRDQTLLFYPTLDDSISDDHPVRLLDEILQGWIGRRGRRSTTARGTTADPAVGHGRRDPLRLDAGHPLQPDVGVPLRTHNIDFMWLAEGRIIDHTTICKFRTRFRGPLKDLFRQVGKLAMQMGLIQLVEVAFDGTRVKANASRLRTWTAERLEAALKELDALFEQADGGDRAADAAAAHRDGGTAVACRRSWPPPRPGREAARNCWRRSRPPTRRDGRRGSIRRRTRHRFPRPMRTVRVMPNKEGGYAPNYTPLAADGRGAAG